MLSKGELDILAALLTLHYSHRNYPKETLDELLTSPETLEAVRKKIRINSKMFNKLLDSLKEKGLILEKGLNSSLTKYPKDGKFKLYVSFVSEK
jgi:predicted transcriptional regulator